MSLRSLFPALACSFVFFAACAGDPASSETRSETEGAEAPTDESGSDGDGDGDEDGDCPSGTPAELAACVDGERYLADLEFIAAPREPGSGHWQAVQDLCFERFAEYGFEVDTHVYPTGVNVVGRKPGTTAPHEQIVVAAHYDHIPGCNGADDNATGTAAVLEAARVLSKRDYPRTLIVACWDQEEWGLIGAKAYANAAATTNQQILFNYNYEMIGFSDPSAGAQTVPAGLDLLFPEQYATLTEWNFRGDWIALIVDAAGLPHAQRMAAHADALGLAYLVLDIPVGLENSPLLSDLQRSDHAAFWAEGYPAMMITDTSEFRYSQYHCGSGEDAVELLDHDFARKVIAASVGGAAESLGL